MLYLIDVYAKSAKEDLTDAEKKEIRKLTTALEAADERARPPVVAGLSEALAHARGEVMLPEYTVTVPSERLEFPQPCS